MRQFLHKIIYYIEKVLKRPNTVNGFIERKPKMSDYIHKEGIFGFFSKTPYFKGIDLKQFRSEPEQQNKDFERMHCTNESYTNAFNQTINGFLYLIAHNKADKDIKEIVNVVRGLGFIAENGKCKSSARFSAITSGTTRRGNGLGRVAEAGRKKGLVPEHLCPFDVPTRWNDYYNLDYKTDGATKLRALGLKFAEHIEIKYEWVDPSEFNDIKIFGSVWTSMFYKPPRIVNGIYQRTGLRRNHAIVNDSFVMDKYDDIFNSYPPFAEKVSWDFDLGMGILLTIKLKKKLPNPLNKFLEDYDGENIKHKDSPAIWHLQKGKKKLYTSWLTYLAFNGLDRGFNEVDRKLIENTPNDNNMELRKSRYWDLLKHLKEPDNMNALLAELYKK